jgi:hypothetical protein
MVALRRGGNIVPLPLKEGSSTGRDLDADAVIRQCEADVIP